MKKKVMNPEVLEEGIAVCKKECVGWRKQVSIDDHGKKITVITCSLNGEDSSVVRTRPVCVPWVKFLANVNARLIDIVQRLLNQKRELKKQLTSQVTFLKIKNDEIILSGVNVRSKLIKAEERIKEQAMEIDKLISDVNHEDMMRQHQWEELKKVQNYRKGKRRFEERLEKALEKNQKLMVQLDEQKRENERIKRENDRLRQEDKSKAEIIFKYEEAERIAKKRVDTEKEIIPSA